MAALLQEHLLGVSVQFKADQVITRDAPLEDKNIRRLGHHDRHASYTLNDVRC